MRINPLLSLSSVLLCASLPAAQLTWDPLQNGSGTGGSGNWDATSTNTVWYNGTSDIAWSGTGTAPVNGAIFNGPDAAPGTYQITNDNAQMAVTNMQVNANGYVFYGPNAIYVGANEFMTIAPGKTATFNCNIAGSGTAPSWILGSGSTMNVAGSATTGQQVHLAGPSGSVFNLTGSANAPTIMFILAPVNMTAGTLTAGNNFFIGYPDPTSINGIGYSAGSLTIANATLNENSGLFIIARTFGSPAVAGTGVFNVQNGSAVNIGTTKAGESLDFCYSAGAGENATVNMQGGVMTVGASGFQTSQIIFFPSAASTGAIGTLNETGGTLIDWGGISIAPKGGSAGSVTVVQTGGSMNLGPTGIVLGGGYAGTYSIIVSGGTIGDLASSGWSSALPITLGPTNGNITFNPTNTISLSGGLTGTGGLNVASGTLALSGANNYSGLSAISNGTLSVATLSSPTITGPVTVDAASGTSAIAVVVSSPGQYWTNNGALTFQHGTSSTLSANFQFGVLAPSTAMAPIQVNGGVAFNSAMSVNVGGSAIAMGTYPLITYTGSVNGTVPSSATINLSGGTASGYVTNLSASKTIALVVTASTYNPALYWAVGNGVWDINTTANWKQFNSPVKYADGDEVVFDDSAAGPSPMTVTLNIPVNPLAVVFNNMGTTNYTISGPGNISGSAPVSVLGTGAVTLATANSFTGGTTVGTGGELNLGNAGALGSGSITLDAGATIDNGSGSDVTFSGNSSVWDGNFTYAGSANNLNTGTGSVTMNANTAITVGSNNLTVGGAISDGGNNYQLTKAGNGALTLPVGESIGGGVSVNAGLLNIGDPGALGSGPAAFNGGAIDNVTGSPLTLNMMPAYTWGGSFSFLGSSDLNLNFAKVSIPNGLGSITLNLVQGTLTTDGDIANNNTTVIKTGNGTWAITGGNGGAQSLGLIVNAGEVTLNKSGGQAITGGNNFGLTVASGALVQDENSYQMRSGGGVPIPINLNGGTWDLFGWNENIDKLNITSGGALLNTYNAPSIVNMLSGYTASLTGTNCQIGIASGGSIQFNGPLGGTGSLVVVGPGELDMSSNNVYTGSTAITNGATLGFIGGGTDADTSAFNLLDSGCTINVSGTGSQTLNLFGGQSLTGFGSVNGSLAAQGGSTVAPGSPSTIGTLTISGSSLLNGTTMMKLNKTAMTSDQVTISGGTIMYGGTLALQNISGALAVGDAFTLFNASGYSGAFSSISPASPGSGLAWDTSNLAVNGKIAIKTGPVLPPGFSGVSLSGSTLTISGTNGVSGHQFIVLGTTNVATPLPNWLPLVTNSFNGSGGFSVSVSATNAVQFLMLRTQ